VELRFFDITWPLQRSCYRFSTVRAGNVPPQYDGALCFLHPLDCLITDHGLVTAGAWI
jgi:hypothetical protein